ALDRLGQVGKAGAAEVRGELALREGKPSLAATQLAEAVRLLPDDPRLRRRLARAYLEQHKPERALEELEHARRLQPDSLDERALRALVLLQLDRPDEAREEAVAVLARDKERKEAREVLARVDRGARRPPPEQPAAPPGDHDASAGGVHERSHQALKAAHAA